MNTDLTGRVAIVTGGAQGLGLAMAEALGAEGATLALFDMKPDALATAAAGLEAGGRTVATHPVDVSEPDQVKEAIDAVVERFGRLDILVNNAGIRHIAPFLEYPIDLWRRTLDVDLTAPFVCAQAAIPHMIGTGKGKIVNIASITGELALKNRVAYNVAKAGLIMLTKTITAEVASQNIYCNAIGPGVIETPLTREYFQNEELRNTILENTPMARWGQPNDVSDAVVFLACDASDYVNGITLFVDGGWVAAKGY
jgi:NAD(P)-dependent dehydrogenase (short-subunit alcohol dehydrogenase family)